MTTRSHEPEEIGEKGVPVIVERARKSSIPRSPRIFTSIGALSLEMKG